MGVSMRNLVFLFMFLVWSTSMVSISIAETELEYIYLNEYGGKTVETLFTEGDKAYDDEYVIKDIRYYDAAGNLMKRETQMREVFVPIKGYYKFVTYFNVEDQTAEMEFYHPKPFADEKGYYKSVVYFDAEGRITKTE